LLRNQRRVAPQLPEILAKIAKRVLQDMAAQIINPTGHVEALVHEVLPVPEPVLVEKLRLPVIRVPAAVPDPATQEKILPRHEERIGAGAAGKVELHVF